jgi:hypothetical protein
MSSPENRTKKYQILNENSRGEYLLFVHGMVVL